MKLRGKTHNATYSDILYKDDIPAGIAQLVEQQAVLQQVLGSIPTQTWLGVDSAFHPSVGR